MFFVRKTRGISSLTQKKIIARLLQTIQLTKLATHFCYLFSFFVCMAFLGDYIHNPWLLGVATAISCSIAIALFLISIEILEDLN